MQEIINIPFWLVYLTSHCQTFFGAIAIISGVFTIFAVIYGFAMLLGGGDTEQSVSQKLLSSLKISIPFLFIFGTLASLCPNESDFKTYVLIKVTNEIVTSDMGQQSKEFLKTYIEDKVNEMTKTEK